MASDYSGCKAPSKAYIHSCFMKLAFRCFHVLFFLTTSIGSLNIIFSPPLHAGEHVSSARESFERGKHFLDQNRLKEAESAWGALSRDETYGPIAFILLARAYRDANNLDKCESLYQEGVKRFPKSVYASLAKSEMVETMAQQGKPDAIPMLTELLLKADSKSKPGLLLCLAQLQLRLGHTGESLEHFKKFYIQFPATIEGLRAAEVIDSLVRDGRIKAQNYTHLELTERARRLYQAGRFDLAAQVYEAMLREQPTNVSLRIKLATCNYKDRKNAQAINLLQEVLKSNPPLSIRWEAQYLLSRLYWRLDRDKDFQSAARELIKSGNERFKKIGLFNMGSFNFEKKRFEAARAHFNQLKRMGTDTNTLFQVNWKLAWISYLTGDFASSAQQFHKLKSNTASLDLQNACLYWQGRSMLQSSNEREAVRLFQEICKRAPMSYYGYESESILKKLKIAFKPAQTDIQRFPDTTMTPQLLSNPTVQQALALQEMKLHEFAIISLNALPARLKCEPPIALLRGRSFYLLRQYAKSRNALTCAFGRFMEHPPKDAPKEFIEMAFPRVHYQETLRQANKYSLDPNLVWSIIRQESLYDHTAVSPAGAVGLMQVMPKASGLTNASGKPSPGALERLTDPHKNIALGIMILKQNLTKFRGNVVPAVASYNADIRKVKTWVRDNGRLKSDEFVEMIPYQETRLYVKRVLAGYKTYRILHSRQHLAEIW